MKQIQIHVQKINNKHKSVLLQPYNYNPKHTVMRVHLLRLI